MPIMDKNRPVALIAGASGLVGGKLLALLLARPRYREVIALVRRPLDIAHPRLRQLVCDFDAPASIDWPQADDVFCCLGTTIAVAGSRPAFRAVDHTLVLTIAKASRNAGARHFLMVSAMGADTGSRVFYNQVKGEAERDVIAIGWPSLTILRPSLIDGDRAQHRAGEKLALKAASLLRPLIPARYRAVKDTTIARAMFDSAASPRNGVAIIASDAIQAFAQ